MRLAERLKAVEERVDDVRRNEDADEREEHGGESGGQPPPPREASDIDEKEQQDASRAEAPGDQERLAEIAEPACPALYAKPVCDGDVVTVEAERQAEQRGQEQKLKAEGKTLNPATAG